MLTCFENSASISSYSVKSPIKWLGGKFYLAKKIVPLFPPHTCYCEVFGGAAHVLFAKTPSQVEVVNDINGELINFWRVYARFPQWFEYKLQYVLYSRQYFEELKAKDPATLSEEDRAWRYFYLNRCAFSGIMDKDSGCPRFGIAKKGAGNSKAFANLSENLKSSHARIKAVIFDNLDWRKCLALYDSPQTFFYIDPPYECFENHYGIGIFSKDHYEEIAAFLEKLKGKFLVSLNDSQRMRDIFSKFMILNIKAVYTAKMDPRSPQAHSKRKVADELLISNFLA